MSFPRKRESRRLWKIGILDPRVPPPQGYGRAGKLEDDNIIHQTQQSDFDKIPHFLYHIHQHKTAARCGSNN